MNVLIVEDEVTASRGLIKMLRDIDSGITILDQLPSIQETVKWLASNEEPDLILLDIQLKDGLSFDIFDQVDCFAPVIFCTAFDHYAVDAFKLNSIDYLLKPYEEEELRKALSKLEMLRAKRDMIDYKELALAIKNDGGHFKERFLVKAGKKFYQVPTNKIAYLFTQNKVNFIKSMDGRQYVVDEYLDELEQLLDPSLFFRINRQFIVSVVAITSLENDYGKYYVSLEPSYETEVPVSRDRLTAFKKWLGD